MPSRKNQKAVFRIYKKMGSRKTQTMWMASDKWKRAFYTLFLLISVATFSLVHSNIVHAACSPPATTYGTDTLSVDNTSGATENYYLWTRMQIPSSSDNSIMLQVDNNNCYIIGGDPSVPINTWTWVDYQNGATTTPITISLTSGTHSFEFIGTYPGEELDSILLLTDGSCTPTGTGANCESVILPTVSITTPSSNNEVYGNAYGVDATATANNGGSIASASLLVNGSSVATDTSPPFNFSLNTLPYNDGSYTFQVNATDNQGNVGAASIPVYISNGDLNFAGSVGISDLAIMASNWGKTGQTYSEGSINGTGNVNIQNLSILARNWGWVQ